MPAPSTPTSFVLAARARAISILSLAAGGNRTGVYDAVLLTWTPVAGAHPRLQIQRDGGTWQDVVNFQSLAGFYGRAQEYENHAGHANGTEYFQGGEGFRTSHRTAVLAGSAIVAGIPPGAQGGAVTVGFRLRAENAAGLSDWTATVTMTTSAHVALSLTPPTGLAVGVNTATTLVLSWTDAQNHESNWEIELRDISNGNYPYGGLFSVSTFRPATFRLGAILQPSTAYAARVRAVGITGFVPGSETGENHNVPVNVIARGEWSEELVFTTATNVLSITNLPATVDFWRAAPAQAWGVRTNLPPTSTSCTALPAGLSFSAGEITGTPTAAVGTATADVTATDAAGSDTQTLTLAIRQPSIALRYARSPGTDFVGVAAANAGALVIGIKTVPMTIEVRALATGPVPTTITLTLAGAPAWLTAGGPSPVALLGTPAAAGTWDVIVTATNGVGFQTVSEVLHIVVRAVAITSADHADATQGVPFTFPVTTLPLAALLTMSNGPGWLTLTAGSLAGTPEAAGSFTVLLTAAFDGETTTQLFTVTVTAIITIGDDIATVEGWVGDPLLEKLAYHGSCDVRDWHLSGGPPGIEPGALSCDDSSDISHAIVGLLGIPTAEGFFDATITATVCCSAVPYLVRRDVRFAINGGLFLGWLHADRTLYDLQFWVRGDITQRGVKSYYQTVPAPAAQVTSTVEDTGTAGRAVKTSTTTSSPARSSNILAAKLGDTMRFALLIRDGRAVLGTADGVTAVRLTFRLPAAVDGDYLFDVPGVVTTVDGHEYFLAALEITAAALTAISVDDDVFTPVDALAEIHCLLGAVKVSSGTFPVTFVEDVHRG